jgi:hypothetical protein
MPTTFNLVTSTTLGSAAATVTLSGITGYTDLYIIGARVRETDTSSGILSGTMRFNSNTGATYDFNYRNATTTVTDTTTQSSTSIGFLRSATSNSYGFSPWEFYIFNYGTSDMKVAYIRTGGASVSTTAMSTVSGIGLWNNSAAVTSISFLAATTFAANTSFFVYGITKA